MLRIFGFLLGVLVCDLIAMALIIVTECIKDVFRKPKHGSRSASRGSTSREDCEMPHAGRCNRYNVPHSSAGMYATASRMAQEAHDTAVRDSQWLHDDACRMAHESHDTAMFDHQTAVDLHDHVVSDPGFGCCGPFF